MKLVFQFEASATEIAAVLAAASDGTNTPTRDALLRIAGVLLGDKENLPDAEAPEPRRDQTESR